MLDVVLDVVPDVIFDAVLDVVLDVVFFAMITPPELNLCSMLRSYCALKFLKICTVIFWELCTLIFWKYVLGCSGNYVL